MGTSWTDKINVLAVKPLGKTFNDGGSTSFDIPANKPVFFVNAHASNLGLYIMGNTDKVAYNWKTIVSSTGITFSRSGNTYTISSQSGTGCRGYAFYLDI